MGTSCQLMLDCTHSDDYSNLHYACVPRVNEVHTWIKVAYPNNKMAYPNVKYTPQYINRIPKYEVHTWIKIACPNKKCISKCEVRSRIIIAYTQIQTAYLNKIACTQIWSTYQIEIVCIHTQCSTMSIFEVPQCVLTLISPHTPHTVLWPNSEWHPNRG